MIIFLQELVFIFGCFIMIKAYVSQKKKKITVMEKGKETSGD